MVKISKEEKALIKAVVVLRSKKYELDIKDAGSLEHECTGIIGNREMSYRYLVEDFIINEIEKINKNL
jgi:hypothetical protein